MTSGHKRSLELFDAVKSLPSPDRESFLDRECAHDNALRAEVEALLDTHFMQAQTIDPPRHEQAVDTDLQDRISNPDDLVQHIPDRWRIGSSVESGGMGSVFDAHDTVLDRKVAIKLLHHSENDPHIQEKILSEARAMAKLQHPSICPIHEVILTTGTPFLVMQWIDGVQFHEGIRGMPMHDRLEILRQLLSAVDAMHQIAVIHGDIKPKKILIDRYKLIT